METLKISVTYFKSMTIVSISLEDVQRTISVEIRTNVQLYSLISESQINIGKVMIVGD